MGFEAKDFITVALSVLALCLSIYSLWWKDLRRRIALYAIPSGSWTITFINGGKTDILLTKAEYWFEGRPGTPRRAPSQDNGLGPEGNLLLKAGTATQLKTSWTMFPGNWADLVKDGYPQAGRTWVRHDVDLQTVWFDANGDEHDDTYRIAWVGIEAASFRAWSQERKKIDLTPPNELASKLKEIWINGLLGK